MSANRLSRRGFLRGFLGAAAAAAVAPAVLTERAPAVNVEAPPPVPGRYTTDWQDTWEHPWHFTGTTISWTDEEIMLNAEEES